MAEHLKSLLRKSGVSEDLLEVDLKWMDNVEPTRDFLKWIENSLSDRNCITPREIIAHRNLSEHDKLVDDESLESTFQREFTGYISVTSYHLESKVLESKLIETQKRLAIITESHKYLVENNGRRNRQNILLCKADKMLEEEAKRTRALVAGDHQNTLRNLAKSISKLSRKLNSIANNGSPPGTIGFSNLDRFCILVEDFKGCISICADHFQAETEKVNNMERASLEKFDTSNLSRLFNDSINSEVTSVKLMSAIEAFSAALDYLRNDASSYYELPSSKAQSEEMHSHIESVCHEKMVVTMKGMTRDHTEQKRLRKAKLKPRMEKAVELSKPIKLIGDFILNIAKAERLWVLTCKKMLTETVQVLEEEFEDIHKSLDNIQRTQTVQDLSISNRSFFRAPSINSSSFIGGLLTNQHGVNHSISMPPVRASFSIRDLSNPVLSSFKSFEEQAKKSLVCSKTLYNGLFQGPSATPQSLDHYISNALCTKEDLERLEKKWSELNCLQAEASTAEPLQLLLDKLCFMYLRDPETFFVAVRRMEEAHGDVSKATSFCQTLDISQLEDSVGSA